MTLMRQTNVIFAAYMENLSLGKTLRLTLPNHVAFRVRDVRVQKNENR